MSEFELIIKKFVADTVRWAFKPPAKPGPFTITVRGEESEDGLRKNITDITFPEIATGNPDGVEKRRFNIEDSSGNVIFAETEYPWDAPAPQVIGVKLAHGVEVNLSIIDIDQAGNESEAQIHTFTPTDVTAPAKPGEFSMAVTGEVEEP